MRFIFAIHFIFILYVSMENFLAQNIQGDNYTVEIFDKDCEDGFYLNLYSEVIPNPFSPSFMDFEILFGVPDSSVIKLRIFSADDNESIVMFEMKTGRGCYILKWMDQNFKALKGGLYFCSIEALQKNQSTVSEFNATKKFIIPK
ncbi:MAG: hypothetical protein IPL53_04470 [Ignavibacteria bacterium]|nr:hypothetical protein [Ignavibacteria bacterium]